MPVLIGILLLIFVCLLCSSLRVVRQANAYVIERLGTYTATWGVGLHLMVPVIDKVARKVSLKEQVRALIQTSWRTVWRPACGSAA